MTTEAAVTISKMLEALPEHFTNQVVEHVREYIAELKDEARWNSSFLHWTSWAGSSTRVP